MISGGDGGVEITKQKKINVLCVWLVFAPPSFFLAYTYFPTRNLDWINISILFLILLLTMILPLRIQDVDIPLDKWITITVLLQYGVFVELIFMQLAIFVLVVTNKSTTSTMYRLFSNSLMFVTISIISGLVFQFAGGTIGSLEFSKVLIYSFLYVVTYVIVNNVLLKLYFHSNGRTYSLVSKGAIGDYIVAIVMLPFAVSVYFLQVNMGNKSLFLLGIPFLIVLLISRSYIKSNNLNEKLAVASEIGHELADRLLFDEIIETFIKKMKDVISYDNAYVINLRNERHLHLLTMYEERSFSENPLFITIQGQMSADDDIDLVNSKIYNHRKELKSLKSFEFVKDIESVMTVPIIRNQKTEGFVFLTSRHRNVFRAVEQKIVDILVSYFSISMEKARYFEMQIATSNRCGLTALYNFRYFDTKLNEQIEQYRSGIIEHLSIILLDLDYFKSINDLYGHESGNTILMKVANLLQQYERADEVVARYGGEEFVFLLPGCTKSEAIERAEEIRKAIERITFTIIPDLSENRTPLDVRVTTSLGVATVPNDADTVQDLLRNADRALYIGGKQAGRNRVGIYGEEMVSAN